MRPLNFARARGGIAPALVLMIGLLFSAGAALGVHMMAHARDEARFAHAIDGAVDRITARLDAYMTVLRGGASFVSVADPISFEEFNGFVSRFRLSTFYPGVQGLGFTARIRPESADSLIAAMRSGPFPAFEIWPADPPREELHSILYLVPLDERNRRAIGYDMYSEDIRREAMSAARDSGRVTMSGKVTLVQEIDGRTQAGFLLYAPVYESAVIPLDVDERRRQLSGFFYAPFRADDLFDGIFGSEAMPQVAFRVYDGDYAEADNLLHDSAAQGIVPARTPAFEEAERIVLAERPWTIVFSSTAAFEAGSRSETWVLMLLLGLAASAGLYFVALREARARAAAEGLADQLKGTSFQLEEQVVEVRTLNAGIERANEELTQAVEALQLSNAQLEDLRREAESAREEADRANRAKSEFLAAMSHELRTPLNAIMGYAELMEMGIDGPLTDRQRKALGRIRRSQSHLLGLINDILNYARIEAGALEVRTASIPIDRLLDDLEIMTGPQVAEKGHTFTVSRWPGMAVLGDEEKIQQILMNLVGNAIKFTPPGGRIEVDVEATEGEVRIRVSDNGPGIAAERIDTIFEPFVQLDRFASRDGIHGVGLGLAISRDLAELVGGRLTVTSAAGAGSAFVLHLQRTEESYAAAEELD